MELFYRSGKNLSNFTYTGQNKTSRRCHGVYILNAANKVKLSIYMPGQTLRISGG
jgi:hypothetical protein